MHYSLLSLVWFGESSNECQLRNFSFQQIILTSSSKGHWGLVSALILESKERVQFQSQLYTKGVWNKVGSLSELPIVPVKNPSSN